MAIKKSLILLILSLAAVSVSGQTLERRLNVAVLDFGDHSTGRLVSETIAENLKGNKNVSVQDRDQARAAARGASYNGSINLSLEEARHLGSVLGTDFFLVGDAQTLRRSPSTGPIYFESYASLFLVSSRTGRLITWSRPVFEAATAGGAESALIGKLATAEIEDHLAKLIT